MDDNLISDVEAIVKVVESEQDKSVRLAQVESLAEIIKEKRKDAIEARRASGIEKIWQDAEDAYEGRDQYNRKGTILKGRTTSDGLSEEKKAPVGRSTVIPNITRPYCDAAAARVSDMLLPTDDRNWALRSPPDPKLVNSLNDVTPAIGIGGQPMLQAAVPQPAQATGMLSRIGGAITGMFGAGQPQQQPAQPEQVTVGDFAQQTIDASKKAAERAQTVIDGWLTDCRYHGEVRKVIESCARLGVGILKGPHPSKSRLRAAKQVDGVWVVQMEEKTVPTSVFISPWNFYPDPNCGMSIQKGSYCFEYDSITARALKDLKGQDDLGYIDEMIDLCIDEGPISANDGVKRNKDGQKTNDKDLFDIWYMSGYVSKKDMNAAGCECDQDDAPCTVTMVNDRIIKITMSVLDSGELPYDVMVWQERTDSWAGIGVAEQMATCQKSLTGAVRSLQDNASLSSGPQIIADSSKIEPADGKWHITPNKLWRKKLNAEGVDDVNKAFTIISIETRQTELLNIINYWTKTAEDVTGLPMLLQGQQGAAPDTLGGMQIVNNNGSTVLRRIARTFDDRVTEPHIGRHYEYLLLHGPEDAKGDFKVDARGSSALVERDIQNRAIMQLTGASLNPAYGLDPAKVMRETLKGMRLDPKNVEFDEAQKKEMASRQPPEDPRITAAKIMADAKLKLEEMDDKDIADHAVAKAQLELQRQKFEAQQAELDRNNALVIASINERMQSTQLTSSERQNLDKIKATLAQTSAKLNVTKDLAVADHTVNLHTRKPQVIAPAVEPDGRAPDGEAWQK